MVSDGPVDESMAVPVGFQAPLCPTRRFAQDIRLSLVPANMELISSCVECS